jgi:ribonuclease J
VTLADEVRIGFLGGLGEIGRNCAFIESGGKVLVIDCGVMFPDPEMPGIDLVLPSLSYLQARGHDLIGVVLTHGHEDHVGALGYLARELPRPVPVLGSALTLAIARRRVAETGPLERLSFERVEDGERRCLGPFEVEFLPVAHSVPHAFALVLRTPQGVIVHSGDFKLDPTPVDDRRSALDRMGAIATTEGVRLLMSDSTNADEPGMSGSEREVGRVMRQLFAEWRGRRVVVACFASHLHRVQQVVDAARDAGRRIAFLGRSMIQNVELARELGVLALPDDAIVSAEELESIPPGRVCVVSTGSQGEPLSALALAAAGEHKALRVGPGDVVVLSAHPIPGNEWAVARVLDGLARRGAEVVHSELAPVHVTGHARQEELMTLLGVVRPDWFVPIHGEYRHLVAHARLAARMGVDPSRCLVVEDGASLMLTDAGVREGDPLPADYVLVDGTAEDADPGVIHDRRLLAEEGVLVVVATVDAHAREVLAKPEIVARGWAHGEEADEDVLAEAESVVLAELEASLAEGTLDHEALRRRARLALRRFVRARTGRRPLVLPVVVTV